MDRYITFIALNVYDLAIQLNENAANGYVLAILNSERLENAGGFMNYTVVMEHQPVQPPLRPIDRKYIPDWKPPDPGSAGGEPNQGGSADDADS